MLFQEKQSEKMSSDVDRRNYIGIFGGDSNFFASIPRRTSLSKNSLKLCNCSRRTKKILNQFHG